MIAVYVEMYVCTSKTKISILSAKVVITMAVSVNTLERLTSDNGAGKSVLTVPGQSTIQDSATQLYIFPSTTWISEIASNVSQAVFILKSVNCQLP